VIVRSSELTDVCVWEGSDRRKSRGAEREEKEEKSVQELGIEPGRVWGERERRKGPEKPCGDVEVQPLEICPPP
jgi:hypothetical protein